MFPIVHDDALGEIAIVLDIAARRASRRRAG